jgi:hypothetical protein
MPSEAFVTTMADVCKLGSFLTEDDDGFLSLMEGEEVAYLLLRLLTRRFTEEPLRSELLLIVVEELSE